MFSVQYTGLAEIAGTGAQRCAQDARDERLTGLIETVLGAWICGLHLILWSALSKDRVWKRVSESERHRLSENCCLHFDPVNTGRIQGWD